MQAWRWAALLGFALLAPVGLPAGGAERRPGEIRRRTGPHEPLVSPLSQALRAAPERQAPVIGCTEMGVPLRVLRRWIPAGGPAGRECWLQVELPTPTGLRRGWLLRPPGPPRWRR